MDIPYFLVVLTAIIVLIVIGILLYRRLQPATDNQTKLLTARFDAFRNTILQKFGRRLLIERIRVDEDDNLIIEDLNDNTSPDTHTDDTQVARNVRPTVQK